MEQVKLGSWVVARVTRSLTQSRLVVLMRGGLLVRDELATAYAFTSVVEVDAEAGRTRVGWRIASDKGRSRLTTGHVLTGPARPTGRQFRNHGECAT